MFCCNLQVCGFSKWRVLTFPRAECIHYDGRFLTMHKNGSQSFTQNMSNKYMKLPFSLFFIFTILKVKKLTPISVSTVYLEKRELKNPIYKICLLNSFSLMSEGRPEQRRSNHMKRNTSWRRTFSLAHITVQVSDPFAPGGVAVAMLCSITITFGKYDSYFRFNIKNTVLVQG